MASQQNSSRPRTGAAARVDPACGTCRKKSRKCDRARPECARCVSKGLVCEGYPLSFKIYEGRSGVSRQERAESTVTQARASLKAVLPLCIFKKVQPSNVEQVETLLAHYERAICTTLPIPTLDAANPFIDYILPLTTQNAGLLEAVLGLSACHMMNRDPQANSHLFTAAIEHRLSAFQALSTFLLKEERSGLSATEEEIALAIVLILVLHDICDCGKSKYGAHLNGVAFLCSRIASRMQSPTPGKVFLVTALTWFDLLRGYSGAEKLGFPSITRKFVEEKGGIVLHTLIGCPSEIFCIIGKAIHSGKKLMLHFIDSETCKAHIDPLLAQLHAWDPSNSSYPDENPEWKILALAYKHTAILRLLRLPDSYAIPCTDSRIRASVSSILDAAAQVPRDSTYFKRFLFPLFVAGAESDSQHQQQYVLLCIEHIRKMTGFGYKSLDKLLEKTWTRRSEEDGTVTIPWFDWTCSVDLTRQHDYLFL